MTIQDLILECKMKYSTLYNNNNGSQYYNSTSTTSSSFNQMSQNHNLTLGNNSNYNLFTYNNNEFKDKDTDLTREIRYECIKTLKSFVNTTVMILKKNKKRNQKLFSENIISTLLTFFAFSFFLFCFV